MARPLRLHIPGALYHVMSRGNARQRIFVDDQDYLKFLSGLSATARRFSVRCLAHCVMDNHFHLLLKPSAFPLSRMMQHLNSSYSQWFNRRHNQVGHTLQGRFKALLIDREQYFRRVLRYIVLNPVRAGLVEDPGDWRWSSYRATAGLEEPPDFLSLDDVWRAFDPIDASAQQLYTAFVAASAVDLADVPHGPVAYGSPAFVADLDAMLESHHHDRTIVYAERYASRPSLARLFTSDSDRHAQDRLMRDAFERYAYTLQEIGTFVGKPPATVWRRIRRSNDCAPPTEGEPAKIEI
jgi:putative transposase